MFFTRIGKVVAHLIFWFGLIRVSAALLIAFNTPDLETNAAFSRRYLGTATSGEAFSDKIFLYIIAAIILGVVCEISARQVKVGVDA
ncbi:hypothetical protein [Rhizobium sp. 2MFCol3.1]|uniref:hypothetical protein n=1 Tax=Rhizobium sp. 2MFCol3.1 TaxID=1246459 RepID=UPI00039D80A2|nr:hypothetical protein [Rhizobium sp. 2MFCol3.1]